MMKLRVGFVRRDPLGTSTCSKEGFGHLVALLVLAKSFLTSSVKADSMCDCIHDEESITELLPEREKRPIKLAPLEEEPIPIEVMA